MTEKKRRLTCCAQENPTQAVRFFYDLGQLLLLLLAANLLVATCQFFVGCAINAATLPLSIILALAGVWWLHRTEPRGPLLAAMVCFVCTLLLGCLLVGLLYGMDADGNAYHKLAVGFLRYGWNPTYQGSDAFAEGFGYTSMATYLDHYGKQTWIFAASVYRLLPNIECGKVYTLLSMLALFCFGYSYLLQRGWRWWVALWPAGLAACNPIAMAQVDTYYIDGYLFNLTMILILGLTQQVEDRPPYHGLNAAVVIAAAMSLCANVKFTGLLYGGAYCIAYFLFWLLLPLRAQAKGKTYWHKAGIRCGWYALLAAVCVGFFGFNTYITNYLRKGSFLYPLMGEGKLDIMTANTPGPFLGQPSWKNLFYSLFSSMSNPQSIQGDNLVALKIPFTFTRAELRQCTAPDVRVSGLGVLFGGLLILALAVAMWHLVRMDKHSGGFALCVMHGAVLLGFLLLIQESWWARYIPFVYFVVLAALYWLLAPLNRKERQAKKLPMIAAGLFTLLLLLNNAFFLPYDTLKASFATHEEFAQMAKLQNLQVDVAGYKGLYFNVLDVQPNFAVEDTLRDDPAAQKMSHLAIYYKGN